MKFEKLSKGMSHSHHTHHPFTSFYSAGHIAEGTHHFSALNPTGSTKITISSVRKSERAASGMGRNATKVGLQIQKMAAPSMVKGHRSLFCAHSAELDTEHIGLSNEGDHCENLIPHTFEPEIPTSIV
uniref:Uncharacterized protein n=1 Tax=Arundo donax TaxID=35708 RepID=A0A0A9FBJ9_ARUDO